MKKRICTLITFGLGGHTEYFLPEGNCTSMLSGYDRPDRWEPDERTDYAVATAIAIDKRAVLEVRPMLAISSPMVSTKLAAGAISRCPTPSPVFARAIAEGGNTFGMLLALNAIHKGPDAGPLDSVSVADYAIWWRRHGARIGRFENGAIIWDATAAETFSAPTHEQKALL